MSSLGMGCGASTDATVHRRTESQKQQAEKRSAYSKRRSSSELRFIEHRPGEEFEGDVTPGSSAKSQTEGTSSRSTRVTVLSATESEKYMDTIPSEIADDTDQRGLDAQLAATGRKGGWLDDLKISDTGNSQNLPHDDIEGSGATSELTDPTDTATSRYTTLGVHRKQQHLSSEIASTSTASHMFTADESENASVSEHSFIVVRRKVIAAWESEPEGRLRDREITLHSGPKYSTGKDPTSHTPDPSEEYKKPDENTPMEVFDEGSLAALPDPRNAESASRIVSGRPTSGVSSYDQVECASSSASGYMSVTPSSQGYAADQENDLTNDESDASNSAESPVADQDVIKKAAKPGHCAVNGCISSDEEETLVSETRAENESNSGGSWGLRHLRNWSAISNWHLRRSAVVRPSSSDSGSSVDSKVPLLSGMQESFRGIRRARWSSPRTRLLRSRTVDAELTNQKQLSKIVGYIPGRKAESVSPRVSRLNLFSANRSNKRDGVRYAPVPQIPSPGPEMVSSHTISESLSLGSGPSTKACLPVLNILGSKVPSASGYISDFNDDDDDDNNAHQYHNKNYQGSDYYTDSTVPITPYSLEEKMEWGDIARVHMDFFNDFDDLMDDCLEPSLPPGSSDYASIFTPSCLRPSLCL